MSEEQSGDDVPSPSFVSDEDLYRAQQRLASVPLDEVPSQGSIVQGSRLPPVPPTPLIGREEELKTLAQALLNERVTSTNAILEEQVPEGEVVTVALTGPGGIGKTHLASEFARRYGQYFAGGVYWLNFAAADDIPTQVATCGRAEWMNLNPDFDALPLEEQVMLVMSAWQSALPRLLVFDACQDETLLEQWLPPVGGSRVLVTSRSSRWSSIPGINVLSLGAFSRAESIALLRQYLPDLPINDPGLDDIARELDDVPLALSLGGSYLRTNRSMSTADYVASLRNRRNSVAFANDQAPNLAKALDLSFEQLSGNDPTESLALRLLKHASGFAPVQPIPRDVLLSTFALPGSVHTSQQIEDASSELEGYAFVEPDQAGALRLHQVVTRFVRLKISESEVGGPSTHIATDIWTLEDTLGYRAYAYAIYRFLTHPLTNPPLTISIQASWGGGKTSLMRMIQQAFDPEASIKVRQGMSQQSGEVTVKKALNEAQDWITTGIKKDLPSPSVSQPAAVTPNRRLLTVWFNAWKYESTNEVWAGLVDAIMHQVAARINPFERELFWLRLNLGRVDADRIRHRIYERTFNYWWQKVQRWGAALFAALLVFAATALTGSLTDWHFLQYVGWGGISLATFATPIVGIWKFFSAKNSAEQEPAAVSLGDYLDIPNYSAELGFIHHVEADLQRVLDSVPTQLVIFIDDLDRCSPAKVAQVIEAVNLFLGGDFPKCMFVIGMAPEMVAAALQAAHKDMIDCLPTDAGIPVGWRFMDKFVQLPFLIPPAEEPSLARYTSALFSTVNDQPEDDPATQRLAREAADRITTTAAVSLEAGRLQEEHNLDESQATYLRDQLEAQVIQRKLDEGIKKFNDKNPDIRRVIDTATSYFRGNPRELKRFINAFRFQYFLWWARDAQRPQETTLDQLMRWTVLSMKWPEVVRWLRRSGGNDWRASASDGVAANGTTLTTVTRLKLIEEASGQANDLNTWHQQARELLHLTPDVAAWLNDDELYQFFYKEFHQYPEGKRLSAGAGKGLW